MDWIKNNKWAIIIIAILVVVLAILVYNLINEVIDNLKIPLHNSEK